MEDRSALLRELHSQVLGKVLEQDGGDKPRFEKELVESYFNEIEEDFRLLHKPFQSITKWFTRKS